MYDGLQAAVRNNAKVRIAAQLRLIAAINSTIRENVHKNERLVYVDVIAYLKQRYRKH